MDNQTVSLSARLGELLLNRRATVTCAESCTGGGVASAITGIPGSSDWFQLGLVTYANSGDGLVLLDAARWFSGRPLFQIFR